MFNFNLIYIEIFGIALGLTLLIELIILLLLRRKDWKILIVAVVTNIITNLSLNILLQYISPNLYYILLFIFEVVIVLIEALVYYCYSRNLKEAFKLSICCNLASYILGLLLTPFIY